MYSKTFRAAFNRIKLFYVLRNTYSRSRWDNSWDVRSQIHHCNALDLETF